MTRFAPLAALLVLAAPLLSCTPAPTISAPPEVPAAPATPPATAESSTESAEQKTKKALETAVQGVIYGLPLVIMDLTREKSTNVASPDAFSAPVNQFVHVRKFPDPTFKDVVRPNVDTLYSSAWLDLSKEPIVLSVPDTKDRYYLMPILDAWTNVFASPGKRTTGTRPGHYAIVGPGWSGTLPAGVTRLDSPTNMAWIIGRTQTNGPQDFKAVHAIQDQYRLTPLSSFGKPYTPSPGVVDPAVDMNLAPIERLKAMGSQAFFDRLARLLATNPAPAQDKAALEALASIGVQVGQPFSLQTLDPDVARGVETSLGTALEKLNEAAKATGAPVHGWRIPPSVLARFGTEYGPRAVVGLIGLGANLSEDAVYPSAFVDADGAQLDGSQRYVIHFEKGQTPPAKAFWSLTMYDKDSFLVANALNRYAISSWMPLKKNADGSLDIYVQQESPGKAKESNWLPAAPGPMSVTLRIYWPEQAAPSILDGSWKPPAITRVP